MHKKIRILILGATGQVGGHLIKALKSDVSLEVVAAAGPVRRRTRFSITSPHWSGDNLGCCLISSAIMPINSVTKREA